jgi:HEAT repeat protein
MVKGEDLGEPEKMLEHSDPAVRRASAEAIALYARVLHADAKRSAIPLLTKALKDEDQAVSKAAGQALNLI